MLRAWTKSCDVCGRVEKETSPPRPERHMYERCKCVSKVQMQNAVLYICRSQGQPRTGSAPEPFDRTLGLLQRTQDLPQLEKSSMIRIIRVIFEHIQGWSIFDQKVMTCLNFKGGGSITFVCATSNMAFWEATARC